MKADAVNFLAFLKKSNQFTIPIYQRTYSWTESECEQLWKDIFRTGSDHKSPPILLGRLSISKKDFIRFQVKTRCCD